MNFNSIIQTIDIFKPNDVLMEVRTINGKSGYFKDKNNLLKCLKQNQNDTWYFVMNEITDECYNREQREVITYKKGLNATKDDEIKSREWFLIDADPVRLTGVSSTDEEKAKSKEVVLKIYKYLNDLGFSYPIIADSGNGYHLLYKIQARNNTENNDLLKGCLQVLNLFFSNEFVKVDVSVFNAARITKLYGTLAKKGANTPERPHRESKILKVPENIQPTSVDLFKKLNEHLPKPEVKPKYHSYGNYKEFDIDDFLSKYGIRVASDNKIGDVRKIILEQCVFNSQHTGKDAAIFVLGNGAISYKCFHDSCSYKTWKDVRTMFEPDAYAEKQYVQNRTTKPISFQKNITLENEKKQETQNEKVFLKSSDINNMDRSKIVSVKTGYNLLDAKILGANKGELSVWSGSNGSGKSSVLSQLCIEAVDKNFKVALFSGELNAERVKNWLHLQCAGRKNTNLSDNGITYWIKKQVSKKIDDWLSDKFWLYNNVHGLEVKKVLKAFEIHLQQHPCDVMIIDNLMSLDTSEITSNKYDAQTKIVIYLSALAKKYNTHIHFICHPKKATGFLRKEDISGTSDITNAADNVFMIHRVNKDFEKRASEHLDAITIKNLMQYSNIIEVMKNRDLGVTDLFVGLFYEIESKRFLNYQNENKVYGWEKNDIVDEVEKVFFEDLSEFVDL